MSDSGRRPAKRSLRGKVIDQSGNFRLAQIFAKSRHEPPAEFDSDSYILPVGLGVTQGKAFVRKQVIEARPDLPGMFPILIDVVADGAILTVEIAAHT